MLRRFSAIATMALLMFALVAWRASVTSAKAPHHAAMHHNMHHAMKAMMGGGMAMKMSPQAMHYRRSLNAAERAAARKGHYSCCIKPQCDWCMTHMGECNCYKGIAMGMGACRECHGGWEAGQGRVPGKTKDEVRNMKTMGM